MNRLNNALAIIGASLALVCTGLAQGPGGPGGGPPGGMRGGAGNFAQMRERSRKMEDDMFAQLHLNATQKHKIEVFRNERDAKVKKAMESASKPGAGAPPPPTQGGGRGGGGRGGFGAMRPIMKEYRDKVEGILTPDQKTKYEALRKEMRARMGGGRGGPGGPGGGPPPGGGRPGGGA